MRDFKEKTAFITGGASGLGLAIAKAFSREGLNVILVDIRKKALDEAIGFFKERNLPAYSICLDVTDREAYEKVSLEAEEAFGKIHVLVNNAGIGCARGSLWDVSYKDIDLAIRLNLSGTINGLKIILPIIFKHGENGHVVNTSSKNGIVPVPALSLYNMTKQAVVGLTETLAADLIGTGVGASVFCPGPYSTNLGVTSREVQAAILNEDIAPARPMREGDSVEEAAERRKLIRHTDDAAERVIRGIKRDDLYIFTHAEFKNIFIDRMNAMLRAFPDEVPNEMFVEKYSFLLNNPVFKKQSQVPSLYE